MAETQNKVSSPASSEQQVNQPPYNGQHPGGMPYPPPGTYPPYYAYPPPTDANGHPTDPSAANGPPPGPYMMAFPPPPPGMIYAYPPPGQAYGAIPFAHGMPLPAALMRPKRKQVKMACTNCAAACKRCDEARPCERCIKYGVADSCADGVRKERKKGIKRGPYKRKGKLQTDTGFEGFPAEQNTSGEWHPQGANAATEGYYHPYFYPPPGFVPVGPDGQPLQPDAASAANGQPGMPPHAQYYPLHPAYPPFPPYGHAPPGTYPTGVAPSQMSIQHPGQSVPEPNPPIDPAKTTGSRDDGTGASHEDSPDGATNTPSKSKKRARPTKEDVEFSPKMKKVKAGARTQSSTNGGKRGKKGGQEGEDSGDVGSVDGQPRITTSDMSINSQGAPI